MISKIFGKKGKKGNESALSEIEQKVSQMKLSDMVLYIKGKNPALELSEEGLIAVLERLQSKINEKRYFLDKEDDDSKIKKAFDLVLLIAKNKKVTVKAVELIASFLKTYEHLIYEYDKKHKEIYQERLTKSIDEATVIIEAKVALQNKMNMLD